MEIPKQQILEFVQGGSSAIVRADEELPDCVDIDRDAALLADLGIDVANLLGQFNGGTRLE